MSAVQAGSQAARGGRLPPPLPVVTEGGSSTSDRQGIAFVAVVILYGQLLGYGFWVATGVVEEKSTRVVELLLSAIRPRQLLAGKVIGIGLLGLGQLILIGLCGVIIGAASGQLDVNGDVVAAVGVVMLWFLLGFALYSCAFAVAGALVPRQEEIQAVTAPLTILILASFFLSFGALDDPSSTLARVLSLIPPSAPMVMPVRLIAGNVPAWEVVLSIALTAAAAAGLIAARRPGLRRSGAADRVTRHAARRVARVGRAGAGRAPLAAVAVPASSRSASSPTETTSAAWIAHRAGPPDSITCSSSRCVSFAPHSSQRSPAFSSVFSSRSMRGTLPLARRSEQGRQAGPR